MSDCAIKAVWAGEERVFDLGAAYVLRAMEGGPGMVPYQLVVRRYSLKGGALPGQFGDTPAACLKRFEHSVYSVSDVERIIELGLWGGGLPMAKAADLVDQHVKGKPLATNALLACNILTALFMGGNDARAVA